MNRVRNAFKKSSCFLIILCLLSVFTVSAYADQVVTVNAAQSEAEKVAYKKYDTKGTGYQMTNDGYNRYKRVVTYYYISKKEKPIKKYKKIVSNEVGKSGTLTVTRGYEYTVSGSIGFRNDIFDAVLGFSASQKQKLQHLILHQ